MDQQRALLDELMGVSRDGERQEVKRKFTDDDVCKFYIQGFCFMEEFQRTKHNYGDCDKVHDEECKAAWEALPDEEKAKHPYEGELWAWLEKMMGDVRSKIKRNQERISKTEDIPLLASDQTKLAELDAEIKALVKKAGELGEEGDVDGAQNATNQAESLKVERITTEEEARQRAQDSVTRYGEQEVCPYSGVIVNREESRLRDHKAGRNYRAWVRVHEMRKAMEETFRKRGVEPPRGDTRRGSREDSNRDRDRKDDRGRDRDRERQRDRYRERSRDRGRDRDRDRDDRRSRDYGSRDSDRYRDRGNRDRDRSRR